MPQSPRRKPRQDRSRSTVERILDAAARLLVEVGYDRASTNRIARAAGVSPGSLYQYFADKEAIVAALSERLVDEFTTAIGPALRGSTGEPSPLAFPLVLDAALAALEERAELLRALADRVPTDEQRRALHDVRERLADRVLAGFVAKAPRVDAERRTWIVVELAQHLLIRYVLDSPPIPRQDFLAETSAIVAGLAAGARAPQPAGAPPSSSVASRAAASARST